MLLFVNIAQLILYSGALGLIGQGLLYRAWGYKATFVLIIDSNKNPKAMVPKLKNKISDLVNNLFVYIY